MTKGLTIEDLVEGSGPPLTRGMSASVEIRVFQNRGDEIPGCYPDFPITLTTRGRDHPPGLVDGVLGMRKGGIRRIRVPPGAATNDLVEWGRVPRNAVVVYEVHLLGVYDHWHQQRDEGR